MLFDLTLVLSLLYLLLFGYFIIGLFRIKYRQDSSYEPTVSVVVAARNEESRIHRFLDSLKSLEYPTEKLEVILVDDQSTDKTYELMKSFASQYRHVKVLRGPQQTNHLRGKVNAVAYGIDHSRGELIFLTDADCSLPSSWIRSTVSHYGNDVGLVAGYTLLESGSWFQGMQSLDWAFIHALAAGAVGMRHPLSCAGNNFSFRRKAYEEVGGFRNLPFCITEDLALFTAVTKRTRWDYRYLLSPENLIISQPCNSFRELFRQKQRWGVGGLDLKLKGFLMISLGLSLHVLLFVNLLIGPLVPILLMLLLPKIIMDIALLGVSLKRLKLLPLLKYFPLFELYYPLYVIALPFMVFFGRKVVWKGREFEIFISSEETKSPANVVDGAL